jgi:hypothetical protein
MELFKSYSSSVSHVKAGTGIDEWWFKYRLCRFQQGAGLAGIWFLPSFPEDQNLEIIK